MNQRKDWFLPVSWICAVGVMILLLLSHTYNDILITARHGMNFWNILFSGDILHFFELNYAISGNVYFDTLQGCAYNILYYVIFAVWNIPMVLLEMFANVDVMNNIICIAYIKMITVAALIISVLVLRRILILLNVDKQSHELLLFLYLTSTLMVAVAFIISQYDLVSVVFQLLGIQAFLEKKDKKFVFFFGIAFCLKYFSLLLFLPLLLLRHKRIFAWIKAFVGALVPLALTSLPFINSYDRFATDITENLLNKMFSFSGSGYSPFVVLYCFLLVWCFLQEEDETFSRKVVWASFVTYGLFCSLLDGYLYWSIMFAPVMVLMISQMPKYLYLNLLLETLGYACLVVGHMIKYRNFFFGDTMKSMLMSRIVSEKALNYDGSWVYFLTGQLGMKEWVFPACNSVFLAAVAVMAFLGYPSARTDKEGDLRLNQECREMMLLRLLVSWGICLLPILSLFI